MPTELAEAGWLKSCEYFEMLNAVPIYRGGKILMFIHDNVIFL